MFGLHVSTIDPEVGGVSMAGNSNDERQVSAVPADRWLNESSGR